MVPPRGHEGGDGAKRSTRPEPTLRIARPREERDGRVRPRSADRDQRRRTQSTSESFDAEMTVEPRRRAPLPGRDDLDEPTVTGVGREPRRGRRPARPAQAPARAARGARVRERQPDQAERAREARVRAAEAGQGAPRRAQGRTTRTRGIHLDEVAGGWVFRTSPQYAPFVRDLTKQRPVRLTRAQVETLAIIAYRQPITRPEIDDVRGVDSGPGAEAPARARPRAHPRQARRARAALHLRHDDAVPRVLRPQVAEGSADAPRVHRAHRRVARRPSRTSSARRRRTPRGAPRKRRHARRLEPRATAEAKPRAKKQSKATTRGAPCVRA